MSNEFTLLDLVNEDNIMMGVDADSMEDLLTQMCVEARNSGFVKESYVAALIERELLYPTGLPTTIMKVAIPHIMEKDLVIKPGIFIAKLNQPVAFKEMGDNTKDVMVEMVFMLVIDSAENQLPVLQKVMSLFTNNHALSLLKKAVTKREIVDIISTAN